MMPDVPSWTDNWLWSLPLISLTVVMHGFGLILIRHVTVMLRRACGRTPFPANFGFTVSAAVLMLTTLHGGESAVWALAYMCLGALVDFKTAMLYSLNAMTTYGHANISLAGHWQLMGALEALDGMILFGLTTAFLFSIVQPLLSLSSFLPARSRSHRRDRVTHSAESTSAD